MSVNGFGANSGEKREQRLIPDKLTAYRMFRFRPRLWTTSVKYEWAEYGTTEKSTEGATPCLSAAAFPGIGYDRPGMYIASCERRPSMQSFQLFKTLSGKTATIPDEEEPHGAPAPRCSCGFWAYYTPEVVDTGNSDEWLALAAVKVWGNVVLGDKGVRAQKMEIVALQIPPELMDANSHVVDEWTRLAAKLKVPYFWARSELLKFYPPQDVSELLPKPEPAPAFPFDERFDLFRYTTPPGWNGLPPTYHTYNTNTYSMPLPGKPGITVHTTGVSTYYESLCCVCGAPIAGNSPGALDVELYHHMMTQHP